MRNKFQTINIYIVVDKKDQKFKKKICYENVL